MLQANWHVFDSIIQIAVETCLLITAACVALGQNPLPLINQPSDNLISASQRVHHTSSEMIGSSISDYLDPRNRAQ